MTGQRLKNVPTPPPLEATPPALTLSVLGPFETTIAGVPLTGFPTDKIRALLTYLALNRDTPHRRETLATLFWSEWDDQKALSNLRRSLHRLRQTIAQANPALADHLLLISRQTVCLKSEWLRLDVAEFRARLAASQAHAHDDLATCSVCLAHLTEAVALYRGEWLAGLTLGDAPVFEEWSLAQREVLHQQMLQALTLLAEAHERLGDYAHAEGYARHQLALDPWREEGHRQLMRALALSGQQAAALDHYQHCSRLLRDGLGVSPAPETTALYQQLRTSTLGCPAPSPDPGAGGRLHQFPVQFTPFVGRERELDQIAAAFANPECRLLTLVGPGGIGKTRLALQAAQHLEGQPLFEDGLFFVPLTSVEGPHLLEATLANQLGLLSQGVETLQAQVLAHLRERRMLLVLDNFEHLLTPAASGECAPDFLLDILAAAPGVRLLVTSREPLNLRAEWRLAVEGLAYPDTLPESQPSDEADLAARYSALALFWQAATRVQPGFTLSADQQAAVVQLCHLVAGMPLALEIAAGWVRLYDCQTIAQEVARSLDFLVTPLRDMPPRHRSLRAVFEHSWLLLTPNEQAALAQLAVFRGGFRLEAALAVTNATIVDLAALVDKSLLNRTAAARYQAHELLRQFAAERLSQTALAQQVRARHAAYYTTLVQSRLAALEGAGQQEALVALESERDNIHAAWEWAIATQDTATLDVLLSAMFHFYDIRSRFQEGAAFLQQALQALPAPPADPAVALVYAKLRARQGWFAFQLGKLEDSVGMLRHSLAALRTLGATREIVFALNYLGAVTRHLGDLPTAHTLLTEGLGLARASQDDFGASIALNILGQVASLQGDHETARDLCRQSLQCKRTIGDQRGMIFSLIYLGRVEQALGNQHEAQELFRECLSLSESFGDRRSAAFALQNLGDSARALGDVAAAQSLYRESLDRYREIGNRQEASLTLTRLGEVACDCQAWETARLYLRRALQDALALGSALALRSALLALATLELQAWHSATTLAAVAWIAADQGAGPAQQQQAIQLRAALQPRQPASAGTLPAPAPLLEVLALRLLEQLLAPRPG